MRRTAEDIPADLGELIRIGVVKAVDLAAARCIVQYGDPDEDEPAETPPIRWLMPRAGLTRVWSPPSEGEQVLLLAPDGQFGNAVALMGIVQNAFPALGDSTAEMIEFADGARLSYDPEASELRAILPGGATAQVRSPGGLTVEAEGGTVIRGNVTIEGNLSISGRADVDDDVVGGGVSLKDHVHNGVNSGSQQSGPPA